MLTFYAEFKRQSSLRLASKEKRLRWIQEHRHWIEEDWNKVIRTDKPKCEGLGSQRRTFVKNSLNERMLEECMSDGCFGGGKVGDFCRVKMILKKQGNHSILLPHAILGGWCLIGAKFP